MVSPIEKFPQLVHAAEAAGAAAANAEEARAVRNREWQTALRRRYSRELAAAGDAADAGGVTKGCYLGHEIAQGVAQLFAWCERHRIHSLQQLKPVFVAAYIEKHPGSPPTMKQHLAAIWMLVDFLVAGKIVPMNPAASVRGPRHVVTRGKTPVLTADQARQLLDSIKMDSIVGLRDRAVVGLMCHTFARVSALVRL